MSDAIPIGKKVNALLEVFRLQNRLPKLEGVHHDSEMMEFSWEMAEKRFLRLSCWDDGEIRCLLTCLGFPEMDEEIRTEDMDVALVFLASHGLDICEEPERFGLEVTRTDGNGLFFWEVVGAKGISITIYHENIEPDEDFVRVREGIGLVSWFRDVGGACEYLKSRGLGGGKHEAKKD